MKNIGLNIGFSLTLILLFFAACSLFFLDGRRGIFMVVRDADIQGFMLLVGVVIGLSRSWSSYLYGALISGIVAAVMHFFISGAPLPDNPDEIGKVSEFSLVLLSIFFYGFSALTAIFCVKGFLDIHSSES